jgi:hypothetical protein
LAQKGKIKVDNTLEARLGQSVTNIFFPLGGGGGVANLKKAMKG